MEKKIQFVADLNHDELLLEIYKEISPEGFHIDQRDEIEKKNIARDWVGDFIESVKKPLCKNEKLRELIEKKEATKYELIAAISDFLAMFTVGVSPFLLAAFIVKSGIPKICVEYWHPK